VTQISTGPTAASLPNAILANTTVTVTQDNPRPSRHPSPLH
jgi:hypothetical protein